MRIAYLLGSLNRGGTETLILDVFNRAKEVSLDIIGIYRKQGLLLQEFKDADIKLFQLKPNYFFDIGYFLKLRKVLKSEKINIVHAQQPIDAIYAYLACLFRDIKIVLSFHGYDHNYNFLSKKMLAFIIKQTDLNIFVSKSQQKYYQDKYSLKSNEKQKVVYNGISFIKFDKLKNLSIRKELNISENSLLFGSVGNFVSIRDQFTICRFLNLLNEHDVEFSFVFAGAKSKNEPWLYDACVKYCHDNDLKEKVFFLGSRNDVPEILSHLDTFIYSSDHDTFGIAVIEAMYSGIPVFVNDWEVMREITDNAKHGTLYKSKMRTTCLINLIIT